jgi:CRISPR-associated endonuclease Csn1
MRKSRLSNTQPWPTFAEDVIAAKEKVIPTRMSDHTVEGRLFKEHIYHYDRMKDKKSRLGIVSRKKDDTRVIITDGNYRIDEFGAVHLVDNLAFLRLWLDPNARPKGKVKGRYFAEPVYFADIAAIRKGTYVPCAAKVHCARIAWDPVPETAKNLTPIIIFPDDVIMVDDLVGRFVRFDSCNCAWKIANLIDDVGMMNFPSIAKLGKDNRVFVVQEDVLGHCYVKSLFPKE